MNRWWLRLPLLNFYMNYWPGLNIVQLLLRRWASRLTGLDHYRVRIFVTIYGVLGTLGRAHLSWHDPWSLYSHVVADSVQGRLHANFFLLHGRILHRLWNDWASGLWIGFFVGFRPSDFFVSCEVVWGAHGVIYLLDVAATLHLRLVVHAEVEGLTTGSDNWVLICCRLCILSAPSLRHAWELLILFLLAEIRLESAIYRPSNVSIIPLFFIFFVLFHKKVYAYFSFHSRLTEHLLQHVYRILILINIIALPRNPDRKPSQLRPDIIIDLTQPLLHGQKQVALEFFLSRGHPRSIVRLFIMFGYEVVAYLVNLHVG